MYVADCVIPRVSILINSLEKHHVVMLADRLDHMPDTFIRRP
jgi:hypothetical protein